MNKKMIFMRKLFIITTILFAISAKVGAQSIDSAQALEKALNFYRHDTGMKKASGQLQLTLAHKADTEDGTAYYVFNRNADNGFVIISGDERCRDVLGYCDDGNFNYDEIPDNMRWWLGLYTENYQAIRRTAHTDAPSLRKAPAKERVSIPKLMTTKWDQGTPYNDSIPKLPDSSTRFVTGCVATATAQVMKYHNYPEKGIGEHSYSKTYNKTTPLTFAADFGNTTYDWSNMLDTYKSGTYNTTQRKAIAQLMYHVGVSLDMTYNTAASGGSSSSAARISPALYKYFGYDKSIHEARRKYYTDEEWEDLLYNELKAGRPIIYSGRDEVKLSGHEFVCDGYDAEKDLWAINWGWSGTYNGYFAITGESDNVLRPAPSYTSAYSGSQSAIINCMPDCGNDVYWQITISSGFTFYNGQTKVTSINISTTNPQLYYFSYGNNLSVENTMLYLGAAFRNVDTGELIYANEMLNYGPEITPNFQWGAKVGFRTTNIEYNGDYVLVPIYRLKPSDPWEPIMLPKDLEMPHIYVTGRKTPVPTAIESVNAEATTEKTPEYYDLQGRRISPALNSRIKIKKGVQGTKKFMSET